MGAWQPLSDDLPPEVRHFVEQLRLLKDTTGLSLVALGARTAYSKSSWQRYLNATQPPPRQAVTALCRVAGLDAGESERFVVRWELATRAWPRQSAPVPAPVGGPASAPVGGPAFAPAGGPVGGPAEGPAPAPAPGEAPGEYEEAPTVPWWDRLELQPAPEPRPAGRRLLLAALLVLLAVVVVTVVGAVTLG
jgi:hypothetical protein